MDYAISLKKSKVKISVRRNKHGEELLKRMILKAPYHNFTVEEKKSIVNFYIDEPVKYLAVFHAGVSFNTFMEVCRNTTC